MRTPVNAQGNNEDPITSSVMSHSKPPGMGTSVDQLYAEVYKKSKKKQDQQCQVSQLLERETPVDQLYAQMDDKKKQEPTSFMMSTTQLLEMEIPVDQLYFQVDKKSKEKKECPKESEYSTIQCPSSPTY